MIKKKMKKKMIAQKTIVFTQSEVLLMISVRKQMIRTRMQRCEMQTWNLTTQAAAKRN